MTDIRPVVLVTGAGGFVGRHLVPVLAGEGWRVRRAVRALSGSDDEVSIGSIGPAHGLAGRARRRRGGGASGRACASPRREGAGEIYRAVNTEGTLQLARCAAASMSAPSSSTAAAPTAGRRFEKTIFAPHAAFTETRKPPPNPASNNWPRRHAYRRHSAAADLRRWRAWKFQAAGQGNPARRSTSVRCDPQAPRFPGCRESCLVHREPAVRRGAQI